ncbi:MAG: aminomethyl-transferring glycine dehydrogenase subunit GcvPA [Gammaproteobacteria bacterium]|nr:aminomethyl-transferring glycine dehydrogenase subunit GcvPA [Gammaproteobacteria bacterium]
MPFIPHTEKDTREMLAAIGADSLDDLFDEIPAELRIEHLDAIPAALSEMQISRLMRERAGQDGAPLCFIGAGAYEHHIPAAVWDIATRGEYYSAYTPYQAEASQGTLQTIYEFQTMITELTGLDVSNASLYDGASGLAEAALMAVRANRKVKTGHILLAPGVNPVYEKVAQAITQGQGLSYGWLPQDATTGNVAFDQLPGDAGPVAVVMQQPTFPGTLEDVDRLTDWAHAQGAFAIGIANPTSLALLKAPGQWGGEGVDIACGEGQPLGVPLSSGGPYFGYMTCKQKHVRQMPGRIVGRTTDLDGNPGFALTLQAREQHIRRTKATSNICTNQGLMVTGATIYMSLLGFEGIARVARRSHANTKRLVDGLCAIDGIEPLYAGPYFHEVALRFDRPVAPLLEALAARNILGGYDLSDYSGTDAILVCATETKTNADIDACVAAFAGIMG